MRVVVAGGHGKIGLRLLRLLAAAGHEAVGLVRNPDHRDDLAAAGAEAAVVDLESADASAVRGALGGADAVVFAAGSGPGSGVARKVSMDRDGAILLADAAVQTGVPRYLVVSSMGADESADPAEQPDEDDPDVFAVYQRAKGAADAAVRARDLGVVVLRPGRLTDEAGTGRVQLAPVVARADVPRDDVAAVLVALLEKGASGHTLELVSGETEITAAVRAL